MDETAYRTALRATLDPTTLDGRAALDALVEGRTALIHSRDPETVRGADRVLWFEDGRLVEDGHPDRLADDPDSRLATWLLEADDPEA